MTEMDQLGTESLAGPTLGLLISLYAVTTGSTFFLLQGSSSSRNFFRAINIFYGGSMFLTMLLVSTQQLTPNKAGAEVIQSIILMSKYQEVLYIYFSGGFLKTSLKPCHGGVEHEFSDWKC